MSDKFQDRTMAFAGICQAAYLVQKVARDGSCDEAALRESLSSILVTNPSQPLEVFNNTHLAIRDGYRALVEQLGADGSQKNAELTRYVVSLIALERKLAKRKDILNMLGERISQIGRQQQHFDLLDEQILANMASIYSDLISPIGPRIQWRVPRCSAATAGAAQGARPAAGRHSCLRAMASARWQPHPDHLRPQEDGGAGQTLLIIGSRAGMRGQHQGEQPHIRPDDDSAPRSSGYGSPTQIIRSSPHGAVRADCCFPD